MIFIGGEEKIVGDTVHWKTVLKMNLESKMLALGEDFALQGELIGPNIEGNHYELSETTIRFYSAINGDGQRLDAEQLSLYCTNLGVLQVPLVEDFRLFDTIQELLDFADGRSLINSNVSREGIVIRSIDQKISFKAISNKYLLNQKD